MNRRDVPFDEAGFEKNRLDTVENVSLLVFVNQVFCVFIFITEYQGIKFKAKYYPIVSGQIP